MDKVAVASSPSRKRAATSYYVSWEEVNVTNDKGRKEIHYYLRRRDGCRSDLVVIGKEKSSRHTSYRCVPLKSILKLKSRREVIDWLNSIISDSPTQELSQPPSPPGLYTFGFDIEAIKDTQMQKLGHHTKEFLWLGSPWMSRKRKKHYQSFCRNGVKISVHDFVYVLAEEDKRLVAYLEDMYEDSRGNKMVVVRWFHKIDEVGIVLRDNFNDREIFFSLCLQDLSIECIDGLATVLSPQHFEKFLKEATHTQLQPFVCHKQFENDDVKPFDITQVKGYWEQEILRYMFTVTPSTDRLNSQQPCESQKPEKNANDAIQIRPKKKHRQSKDDDVHLQHTSTKQSIDDASPCVDVRCSSKSSIDCKNGTGLDSLAGVGSSSHLSGKEFCHNSPYLKIGSHVEVLSQDSGMRGCWFRALVIKRHKNKVKVRYHDIQDAADEANLLEEWILASRVAVADQLGLRLTGRTTIRPPPESNKGKVSWAVDVGAIVDVWWHDGWWEGIVVQKDSEDKLHVYFPGEKQKSVFGRGDLRHSEEWLGNGWTHIKERPDVVSSILSTLGLNQVVDKSCDANPVQAAITVSRQPCKNENETSESPSDSGDDIVKNSDLVPDLSKDDLLARLKWKSSRKRKRGGGSFTRKLHHDRKINPESMRSNSRERFMITGSRKIDHDNCKYMRDSIFSSSVVPTLSSLVMSR